jgi:hypothetical protein
VYDIGSEEQQKEEHGEEQQNGNEDEPEREHKDKRDGVKGRGSNACNGGLLPLVFRNHKKSKEILCNWSLA